MANLIEQLDKQLAELFQGWNTTSTLLTLAILGFLAYVIVSSEEPDTHPMLLQRQATASLVRHPGESAIYRSPDTPHGYPLRTGLNVKPAGAPAYAGGKDGDLRDIWRRVTGEIPIEKGFGASTPVATVEQGKILTVLGKEEVIEHSISDITKEIAVVGAHIRKHGGTRVAIYLPNSIEFLAALFSCSFYGLTPILIPYDHPTTEIIGLLQKTKADVLIAEAGSLPLQEVAQKHKSLKQVVWVVEKTSRHMDWTEVPKEIGGNVDVSVWHQLVQDSQDVTTADMPDIKSEELGKIVIVCADKPGSEERIIEFTQQNIVAAIGALIAALPARQRLNPSDLFVCADSFTQTYPLCLTLAALFSHSSVAINSVAGTNVSLAMALTSVKPTVVVASAETASNVHATTAPGVSGGLKKIAHNMQTRALDAGRMPADGILTTLNAPHRAAIGTTPGKLRLMFISERAGVESPPLSSDDLSDLRIFTGARIVYALTQAHVAGAIAQTSIYDYRRDGGSKNKHSHFGTPLSSVEVKLVDTAEHKTTDDAPKGEIVVTGPAVSGDEVNIGVIGTFRDDKALSYL
ncbi:Pescadillo [Venturia inaequalis]|nr:Pescadillo [Venturia inaequalis]